MSDRSILSIVLLSPLIAFADDRSMEDHWEQAEWDLGIGPGGFAYQLYPGSRDTDGFLLPVPYFTFRSPLLEIDRGVRGFLYSSDRLLLDISADFALPVDSGDSRVRQGMRDLDAVLQLGPSMEWSLSPDGAMFDERLEFPVRFAVSTDLSDTDHLGWLVEPRYSIERDRDDKQGLSYKFTIGFAIAEAGYHSYYYDVPVADVTPQRSAYRATGGYSGAFLRLRGTYRIDDWVWWLFARYENISGAAFADSPLVETEHHAFIGVGFAWVFAQNL